MSTPVLPQNNLNGDAVPWARSLTGLTQDNSRNIERLQLFQGMSNRANAGQMGVLGRQLQELGELVTRLQDAAQVYSAESASESSGDGWTPNPPSVSASSLSGRFRVSVFGGAAGAMTMFTFSAPGYPRDRILGSSATAIVSRVAGTGGAASLNTVYGSWVVALNPGALHTFTAQAKGTTQYSATQGLAIQVEPLI